MDAERWKRVDDLLHSVLEVPDHRQQEVLRQACASEPLLEQEVQSLLSFHRKLGDFLQSPALPALPSQFISIVSHAAQPQVNCCRNRANNDAGLRSGAAKPAAPYPHLRVLFHTVEGRVVEGLGP